MKGTLAKIESTEAGIKLSILLSADQLSEAGAMLKQVVTIWPDHTLLTDPSQEKLDEIWKVLESARATLQGLMDK